MIVAILSDVHANLPALEQFVRATKRLADAYVCLGDVVNYGPWNDECLEIIHSLPGSVYLEGNHERLFLGLDAIGDESALVREFFEHSGQYFRRTDLIRRLPTTYELAPFLCVHTIDRRKIYADTDIEVTRSYMIGHTHHQYQIERSGRLIVNCGSVGQNRGDIETVSYALYDTTSRCVRLRQEPYLFETFMRELAARGYSRRCIEYYAQKQRLLRPGPREEQCCSR